MLRFLIALLRRTETRALLTWLAAAGAVMGFLEIADDVGEGDTDEIDRRLLMMMREPGRPDDPIGPRAFEEAMRDVTALGGFTVLTLLTVAAVVVFALHRSRRQAAVLALTVLSAQWTSGALKDFYDRPRPNLVPHGSYVYSESFPSGHSTLSAATWLTLATMIASLETRPAMKALAYALATLIVLAVGASRVYLGVHWPSDVLAGWAAGAAFAFAAWIVLDLWRRFGRRQKRDEAS